MGAVPDAGVPPTGPDSLSSFEFELERFVAESGRETCVGVEWADLLSLFG